MNSAIYCSMLRPKHIVDFYVINYTYLYQHIVVLDKYTHTPIYLL